MIYAYFGFDSLLAVLRLIRRLLTDPHLETAIALIPSLAVLLAFSALIMMLRDSLHVLWPMLYAGSLPILGITFLAIGISGLFWPETQAIIQRAAALKFSPVLFKYGIYLIVGTYVLMIFVTNVLFLPVASWLAWAVVAVMGAGYLLMFSLQAFSLSLILLLIVAWATFAFLWSPRLRRRIRDWLDSWLS